MGSKGSNTTTQSYTPNQTVGQSGTTALTMAQAAAGQPFQQPVAPVAGFTDDQLSAFANMRAHQGYAEPYFQRAGQLFNQSAAPITAGQVGNYLNPFADYVMGGLRDVFGQQMRDTTGRLTQAAGGVGADRIGVAQANLAKQQGLAAGQTLAGIYQPALGAAQQDAARQQAAAFGFGQMGPAAQGAAMAGTQGLYNFGSQQQQLAQAQQNAPYQLELARLAYPFQTAQFLSGVTAGTAPALGGTTTNTYPKPSPWGTIAGLGMTAAGAMMGNPYMMGSGLKGTMGSQSMGMGSGGWGTGGWNPNVSGGYVYPTGYGWERGGAVGAANPFMGYQGGGDVVPNFADRFSAISDDPRVAAAMEFGDPLPESASVLPPPMPRPRPNPMEIQGEPSGEVESSPTGALSFVPQGPGTRAFPPPTAPQMTEPQSLPFALPPDEGAGSFARTPGMALMQAGLATLAAAGKRDSRGLPLPPFAAIGEGGMQGVKTLEVQQQQQVQRRRVELEALRLLNQAEHQRRVLGETSRYHDILDRNRQDQLAITGAAQEETARHNRELERRAGDPRMRTPEQQALIAASERLGRPLNDEEVVDIVSKMRQQSRNPPRPLTPEQQALDARRRELGRDLTPDEIAEGVQRVRRGVPTPAGEAPPSNILGEDDVAPNFEGATGLGGSLTNTWNRVTGAFGAQAYPAEHKATRILNDLAIRTQSTLQGVSGRPSNYWLGRIGELTVHPNTWGQGPQAARDRLIQTRATIQSEAARVQEIIDNPQTSNSDRSKAIRSRGELYGLLSDYNAVIGAWGGGAGNPLTPIGEGLTNITPSTGEVRQNAEGVAPSSVRPPPRPKNAPPGSRLQEKGSGKSKSYRWVDPSGNPIQ